MTPNKASRLLTLHEINLLFQTLQEKNPHPTTELEYKNSYTLLVAVVLSAQATDVGVNKATRSLFEKVDSPEKMVELGEEGLKHAIKTIGLYPTKAKNILALSHILIEKFQGQVPGNREDLESLPGVGRKTANVVLNVAFGQDTIPVDTHIFRVSNRTGLAIGKNPTEVEKNLEKRVPPKWRHHAHHWLILHGRYICVAKKPKCAICPIQTICQYPYKNL